MVISFQMNYLTGKLFLISVYLFTYFNNFVIIYSITLNYWNFNFKLILNCYYLRGKHFDVIRNIFALFSQPILEQLIFLYMINLRWYRLRYLQSASISAKTAAIEISYDPLQTKVVQMVSRLLMTVIIVRVIRIQGNG